MNALIALFFASGFAGLALETVWLRLMMARFGCAAPLVSAFLAAFMAGLGLGGWWSGRLARRLGDWDAGRLLRLYACAELAVALSARLVPAAASAARAALDAALGARAWGGAGDYAVSATAVWAALLPACALMGASFPLALAAARRREGGSPRESFSALYAANVGGAAAGAALTALALIEAFGLRGTLNVAAALEAAVAAAAFALSLRLRVAKRPPRAAPQPAAAAADRAGLAGLFVAGFCGMAMEVVWIRLYTPYAGTTIYAFASILAAYLTASFAGAALYRAAARRGAAAAAVEIAWIAAAPLSLLPLSTADPAVPIPGFLRALGLVPFSAALGALTPALVDRISGGEGETAGPAYAANLAGCVMGPLAAGFLILPRCGERAALALLAVPLFVAGGLAARARRRPLAGRFGAVAVWAAAAALGALLPLTTSTYEESVAATRPEALIRRDYQASVVAAGRGLRRFLLVDGQQMTILTPITKAMAHLPAALLGRPPRRALVICFGMGTTFRSLVSWGAETTAVELSPSVPGLFVFYHEDAARVLAAPGAEVVIDDGRRWLTRSRERFDLIAVDPPPPLESAGTGMLYSKEFYAQVRGHLTPGGLLSQWIVEPLDPATRASFARALRESFPYTRVFRSFVTREAWGWHVIAGLRPIRKADAAELARRLPPAAAADFVELGPESTPRAQFARLLAGETTLDALAATPAPALSDDRPINEYDVLRRTFPALAPWLLRR